MPKKANNRKLTQTVVRDLRPTSDREYMVADTEVTGFWIRVYQIGTKVFIVRFQDADGKRIQRRLGTWPEVSADSARDMAKIIIGRALGGDKQAREEGTFRIIANEYLDACVRPRAAKSTLDDYEDQLNRILFPSLGHRRMDEIETRHVLDAMAPYANRPTWNRLLTGLIRPIFKYAAMKQLIKADPVSFIRKAKEVPRKPSLSHIQIQAINQAITSLRTQKRITGSMAWAFRLILATGARSGEILALKWVYIDRDLGLIRWPATKTGEKVFPLTPLLLRMLDQIPKTDGNPFVLPGEREGHPLVHIRKAWGLIRTRAGVPDLHIHDLRHVFGTRSRKEGDLLDAKELLSHKQVTTTELYTHATMGDLTSVAEAAAQWMLFGSPIMDPDEKS